MRERNRLASAIEGLRTLEQDAADATELIGMAEAESDAGMVADGLASLRVLMVEAKRQEIESLLSGEADMRDAFLEINAGAGGTEAQATPHIFTESSQIASSTPRATGIPRSFILLKGATPLPSRRLLTGL